MSRTSAEWWQETKNDPEKLLKWLKNQYHGEATAVVRLEQFIERFGHEADEEARGLVEEIAKQEQQHAAWIAALLASRGGEAAILDKVERYWDRTLSGIVSWETGCAVAALAEDMRLDRIRAIAEDPDAAEDIRYAFTRILPQEIWHEKTFRELTTEAAMAAVRGGHEEGAASLGLVV